MSEPDRRLRVDDSLHINMPDMFADPAFVKYLNDPANNIATWHRKGEDPHEYSDCFVWFDNGEGSHADMPEKWWNLICEIAEAQGFTDGIIHITNT